MIYNYCITCEHYNDRNNFTEECYGCFNGRNYNVNHYYDMTKEDIENMIKKEEEENMNNETSYDAELKLDLVESDIIDELLALTKKNNEMLIDIQKRLDESEGLIWPKSPWLASADKNKEALIDIQNRLNENKTFDEKKIIEAIIGDQEKEDEDVCLWHFGIRSRSGENAVNSGYTREEVDEALNRIRRNSLYGMYADYQKILESNQIRDELKKTCDEIDRKLLDINIPYYYNCENCKHGDKNLGEEPCFSCNKSNGNYKFEPMSNVDKLEKIVCDAFANCANAVKEFNRRFNESKEKK